MNEKPILFDLFSGLGGWTEPFLVAGYRCIGFDIEAHDYGQGGYPGELVLADVRTLNGAELVAKYGVPACIVCSPPCVEYSYMAMPWSRAKQIARALEGQDKFPDGYKGSRTVAELNDLFNQCFRIQKEVSEAAGHHVAMVVENVRGAQRWVGKAMGNFGSFYFWGDVPALLPIPSKIRMKHDVSCSERLFKDRPPSISLHNEKTKSDGQKVPGFRFDGSGKSFQTASVQRGDGQKLPPGSSPGKIWTERPIKRLSDALKGEGHKSAGLNWSDPAKRGQDFTRVAGQQALADSGCKVASETGRRTDKGKGARFTSRDSKARKQTAAVICCTRFWLAKCFHPDNQTK